MKHYELWIESEVSSDFIEDPEDDNTSVIITFDSGEKYTPLFITPSNIKKLMNNYKISGECLYGKYLYIPDIIIVDRIDRQTITEIIDDLIQKQEFFNQT